MYELNQSWIVVRYKNKTNHPISNNSNPRQPLIKQYTASNEGALQNQREFSSKNCEKDQMKL